MHWATRLVRMRELSISLLLAAYLLIVGLINPDFLSASSLSSLLNNSLILLVLAVGQTFVLLTAEIDVSIGSTMGISAVLCGMLLLLGTPIWLMIVLVMLAGILIGWCNGIGVTLWRIPSIIMTLGMLGLIRGLMLVVTDGKWIEDIPNSYKLLASVKLFGVNVVAWIGIGLVLIVHYVLIRTRSGRYFYAVGDNPDGAHLLGIRVHRMKTLAFIVSGAASALAGLIFVMNIGFIPNQTGSGMELSAIAAAVLGGVSLSGGLGTALGAGIGAIFLTAINNSLVFLKIEAFWNDAILGFLLLLIVVGDKQVQRLLQRKQDRVNRVKEPASSHSSSSAVGIVIEKEEVRP
jgi:AI-2 transport system permease protein